MALAVFTEATLEISTPFLGVCSCLKRWLCDSSQVVIPSLLGD